MHSDSMLLVRPEHLNHHGFLFGGRLLEWLDEQAYIAAMSRMDPRASLVTVAIDRVEFRHQVREGAVLRFRSRPVHVGRTSLTLKTDVARMPGGRTIFSAFVTFVALTPRGRPTPVAPLLLAPFRRGEDGTLTEWKIVEEARRSRRQT